MAWLELAPYWILNALTTLREELKHVGGVEAKFPTYNPRHPIKVSVAFPAGTSNLLKVTAAKFNEGEYLSLVPNSYYKTLLYLMKWGIQSLWRRGRVYQRPEYGNNCPSGRDWMSINGTWENSKIAIKVLHALRWALYLQLPRNCCFSTNGWTYGARFLIKSLLMLWQHSSYIPINLGLRKVSSLILPIYCPSF